ncbi:MAG: PmeII family type II restriction endonuclease [Candidatus Glassbacteria bacterium]
MNNLDLNRVCDFVNENIQLFHQARLERLGSLNLKEILKKKNPYLFRAKNITTAPELIQGLMDAFISSSEEKMFGDFLEGLAIFVCSEVFGGRKSATSGIDLEFETEEHKYLVSIKSGPNWGNSGQYAALERNFKTALAVLSQSRQVKSPQAILGTCYGKRKTKDYGLYKKIEGQSFWFFISGNPNLYTDIIEPVSYRAKEHNEAYNREKTRIYHLFTQQFLNEFSTDGTIDWNKLVQFNSGNLKEQK